MRKLLMLIAVLFGTAAMVNAKTLPEKTTAVKEVKASHPKHHHKAKKDKKASETGTATSKK